MFAPEVKPQPTPSAKMPPPPGVDGGSVAKDTARDMHEGFKAVAAPLLQMVFGGANLSRDGQEQRLASIKLPPKTEESATGFSMDRFRKDREIMMAAMGRQQAQSSRMPEAAKHSHHLELPKRA